MKTSNILEKVIIYLLQIVFIAGVCTACKFEEKINYKAELQFSVWQILILRLMIYLKDMQTGLQSDEILMQPNSKGLYLCRVAMSNHQEYRDVEYYCYLLLI